MADKSPPTFVTDLLLLQDELSRLEADERVPPVSRTPEAAARFSPPAVRNHALRILPLMRARSLESPKLLTFAMEEPVALRDVMGEVRAIVNGTKPEGFRIVIDAWSEPGRSGAVYTKPEDELWKERFFPSYQIIEETGLVDDTGNSVGPFRQWAGAQTIVSVSERVFVQPPTVRYRNPKSW